jgi:hypothetical protein
MLCSFPVQALERVDFGAVIARSSLEKIQNFYAQQRTARPHKLSIARSDLDGDGLYEFIVKLQGCDAQSLCVHQVFTEDRDRVRSIGAFEARRVMLGNEYAHDMRNLLVFGNAVNDFDYVRYSWHPETSNYALSAR